MQENSPKKITILDIVRRIEKAAIHDCKSLEEVIIPEGVKTIGEFAFWDYESLKRVTIPGSVKRIESGAFRGCQLAKNRVLRWNAGAMGKKGICSQHKS